MRWAMADDERAATVVAVFRTSATPATAGETMADVAMALRTSATQAVDGGHLADVQTPGTKTMAPGSKPSAEVPQGGRAPGTKKAAVWQGVRWVSRCGAAGSGAAAVAHGLQMVGVRRCSDC
mmetsp:Transcript_9526/g.24519  ORF Transcript_9526/g.24519 Transcript_9526/m.24519 type:complete len:122 (+) Transcript_9526:314-679(+)